MKTILVAVDLSNTSSKVAKAAAALAKQMGTKVILLHVLQPINSSIPVGSGMDVVSIPLPCSDEDREDAAKQMELLAKTFHHEEIPVQILIKEAAAVETILTTADHYHASMIVTGSHGRGALYHLFAGSVVTEILKSSKKPVLVIPVHH